MVWGGGRGGGVGREIEKLGHGELHGWVSYIFSLVHISKFTRHQ